ncbi:MAG TPA: ornithine cyclodeaminase family protein [Candidatus Dormibacteraeota bacterium]|nr:ornithine cyclodeaminase family protein [Candidatus Dormibacteraeota bacterium]
MRILSNADVERVIRPQECIADLETAYRELALERAANRPRNHTFFPVEDEDHPGFRFRFKSQEGGNLSSGVWATRITADMAGLEPLPNGGRRRRLIPAAPGGTFVGLVTLYSLRTLEPLAVIHDSYLQKVRVAATSAIGIRELANPEVRVAGLFGSGWQAGAHLEYLLLVRPSVEEIRVYSPTTAHREAFCEEWSHRTGRRVVPVERPEQAVRGCQLVTCATATVEPCFDGSWLEPGTHVTSITSPDGTQPPRRELDDTTFDRADVIVVLSRAQIEHDDQIDILGPVRRGRKRWEEIGELGDLLVGRFQGRTRADQITVFANNTGMGLQFAAVGARVLHNAEALGLGREVPTEWFLEETTP